MSGQLSRDRAVIHQRCCSSGTGLQTWWVAWSSGQSDRFRKGRVQCSQLPPTTLLEPARRSLASSCQGPPSLTCFPGSCSSGWVGPALGVLPKSRWLWGQIQCPLASLLPAFARCGSTVRRLSPIHLSPTAEQHLCKLALKLADKQIPHCSSLYVHERLSCLLIQLLRDPQSRTGILTFALSWGVISDCPLNQAMAFRASSATPRHTTKVIPASLY